MHRLFTCKFKVGSGCLKIFTFFGIHIFTSTIHQNKCFKKAQIIVKFFPLAKVDEICSRNAAVEKGLTLYGTVKVLIANQ